MNSSTSGFKIFAPLCSAVICIFAVEMLCAVFLKEPDFMKSPLLHMAYREPVRMERVTSAIKLHSIMAMPGSILQVGDSTGLAGVQPRIVNAHLPAELSLLNLSMQVPAQFIGHESTAEVALRTHQDSKYLLLMVSPFHIGRDDEGFGEDIERSYVRFPWVSTLPSLKTRALVTNLIFYGRGAGGSLWLDGNSIGEGRGYVLSKVARALSEDMKGNLGWTEVVHRNAFLRGPCRLTDYNEELVMARLQRMYEIAAQHRVRLILVLAPMRCAPDAETEKLQSAILRFHSTHTDMVIPLPIFDAVDPVDLSDEVHLTREGSRRYSERLGAALRLALVK